MKTIALVFPAFTPWTPRLRVRMVWNRRAKAKKFLTPFLRPQQRRSSLIDLRCVRPTTPSHWARCARELSGVAQPTRNCGSFSTRPSAGHRVGWQGFAEMLRGLKARPAATCSTPRTRSKAADASVGESRNAARAGLKPAPTKKSRRRPQP